MTRRDEILTGLSEGELVALADGLLVPAAQHQLDTLLAKNAEGQLTASEASELDGLLAKVDQLNVLKTRARYTLRSQEAQAGGT
jgi:hypothetical protein